MTCNVPVCMQLTRWSGTIAVYSVYSAICQNDGTCALHGLTIDIVDLDIEAQTAIQCK